MSLFRYKTINIFEFQVFTKINNDGNEFLKKWLKKDKFTLKFSKNVILIWQKYYKNIKI